MTDQLRNGLPSAVEAEKSILAQPLLDSGSMAYLRGCVEEDYFTIEYRRRIWRAFCVLFDGGHAITITTVVSQMQAVNEQYPDIISTLFDLQSGEPRQPEPNYLIGTLAEKARLNRLIVGCEHAKNRALAGDRSEEIYEDLVKRASAPEGQASYTPAELIEKYGLDELLHHRRKNGLRLPWPRLNGLLSGLHGGQLVLLAAHTSQGKTSAALQIAMGVAEQRRLPYVFSLETEPTRLFRRMVTQLSGVNPRSGGRMLDYEAREKERTAAAWLAENPIKLNSSARTVPAMISALRRLGKEPKLGLVVVDYLQLVQTIGRPGSRAQEIGNLAREFKLASQEFDVPFLLLSQFNRESAKQGRRPELYDLKESGDVENHSDVVIILHAAELDTEAVNRPVLAYVPKQRDGPRGKDISMVFRSDIQKFEEMAL